MNNVQQTNNQYRTETEHHHHSLISLCFFFLYRNSNHKHKTQTKTEKWKIQQSTKSKLLSVSKNTREKNPKNLMSVIHHFLTFLLFSLFKFQFPRRMNKLPHQILRHRRSLNRKKIRRFRRLLSPFRSPTILLYRFSPSECGSSELFRAFFSLFSTSFFGTGKNLSPSLPFLLRSRLFLSGV